MMSGFLQKKSAKVKTAFLLAILLVVTNLPQTTLILHADRGGYTISLVDGKNNGITSDSSLSVNMVSGGDAIPVAVEPCESGKWNAELDSTYNYTYTAKAQGYQSADGSFTVSGGDPVTIKLKKIPTLAFQNPDIHIEPGEEYWNPVYCAEDMQVEYSPADPAVAAVDGNGRVTRVGKGGKTTITASVVEDEMYAPGSVSYDIIFQQESKLVFQQNADAGVDLKIGDTYSNPAAVPDRTDNYLVTYESSEVNMATVDKQGNVKILWIWIPENENYREVTITAHVKASEDGLYQAADKSYTIRVGRTEGGTLTYTNSNPLLNLYVGQTHQHKAVTEATGGKITYVSDGPNVVEVIDSEGTIRAVGPGSATITITRGRDSYYEERKVTYTVRVLEKEGSPEGDIYQISGETRNGSGWYTGNVSIQAGAGYRLSWDNSFVYSDYAVEEKWTDTLSVTEQGTSVLSFYAKNEGNSTVTDLLTTREILLDTGVDELEVEFSQKGKTFYNRDVELTVTAKDKHSRLKEIRYEVVKGADQSESGVCDNVANKEDFTGTIVIPADSLKGEVLVRVTAEDYAGNTLSRETEFYFTQKQPEISVDFGSGDGKNHTRTDAQGRGYFKGVRTAEIAVVCDMHTFDAEAARKDILNSLRSNGGSAENIAFTGWSESSVDAATKKYTASVTFSEDGNYTWYPQYTDRAGNTNADIDYKESAAPNLFTVDRTLPAAKLSVGSNFWSSLAEILTFGSWNYNKVSMRIEGEDAVSPIYSIGYYKTTGDNTLTLAELADLDSGNWTPYTGPVKFTDNDRFVMYARVEDYAGNVKFLSTDGILVDCTYPSITIDVPKDYQGYYTEDVKADIKVQDMGYGQTGIQSITYRVEKYDQTNHMILIQKDTPLYSIRPDRLGPEEIEENVVVASTGNDSSQIVIRVTTVDIVGNQNTVSRTVKIDRTPPRLTVTQPDPQKALYNQEVLLTVEAGDTVSTLDGITYVIQKADGSTQSGSCFGAAGEKYDGTIRVPADINGDVSVEVTAKDRAGNTVIRSVKFRMNTKKPVISVDFGGDANKRELNGRGYFPAERTAVVEITCDSQTFDAASATETILKQAVSVTDVKGESLSPESVSITDWVTVPGKSSFEDKHIATVRFAQEGNYVWNPAYTDKAGNRNAAVQYNQSQNPVLFTVDRSKPVGTVTVDGFGTWDRLPDKIDFGRTSNSVKSVSGTADDGISPIASLAYYKTAETRLKTVRELEQITDWKEFQTFVPDGNEQMVVYVRVEDYAGNVTYLGTGGMIFDCTAPNVILSLPSGEGTIYAGDVNVGVSVEEPVSGGVSSGIESIDYEVYSLGALTGKGNLYTDTNKEPSAEELMRSIRHSVSVSAEKNNSNQVEIRVTATDHAGNQYTATQRMMIDVTRPRIQVSYDNNSGDTSFGNTAYFNSQRVATISIRERNFDEGMVKVTVTNEDGPAPGISGWSTASGGGNGDEDVHSASIVYSADGKYTFDVTFTDTAGNAAGEADYGNTLTPREFVIDTTKPVMEVVYDNNNPENENYFKAARTATVTIREHNFDESRVAFNRNASENGQQAGNSSVSGWTASGDVHTATLFFGEDAYYSWSMEYTDMAGNQADTLPVQNFYVDTTMPELTVSGIRNHSANNAEGDIGLVLECKDTNFGVFEPKLTTVKKDGNSFTVEEIEGKMISIPNGKRFTVQNLTEDGIYTLHCTAVDRAGNAFHAVQRTDENGVTVTQECSEQEELVQFSVNRQGSVFWLDTETMDVVNHYYIQSVDQDICIYEANTDPLESYAIELNDMELKENKDYTVSLEKEADSWYRYAFRLSGSLFAEEGENTIVVRSVDKTKTTAYSDVKDMNLSFVVDRTPPAVTLSGLSDNGSYRTAEQAVTAIPTDDGGKVQSVRVLVQDSGKEDLRFDLSGEELDEYLSANGGQVSFTVPEGLNMTVRVVCNDYAVNSAGQTNEYVKEYKNVTVSPDFIVIFLANKPLLYGITGTAGAGVAGTASVVSFRRRKLRISKKKC